jgi:cephalosporin-C deacetylase
MPSIDLPLHQLRSYTPATTAPTDFEQFWERALARTRAVPLDFELGPATPELVGVVAQQAWFTSISDARISGWYVRPATGGPFPGVVQYHGYGGRAARPLELYALAAQGIAVLSMDCRGQGGSSPDIPPLGGGHSAGWLTQGLRDPETYYYRYVFADAARAVDALASREEVDPQRLATTGISQGGGLALAAAALAGSVSFVWADVPFLCDIPRALAIGPDSPFTEVERYLRQHPDLEQVALRTLSYFDIANHARRITCPAKLTVGLLDTVCPPSTIFGTFSRLGSSDNELLVLPYHNHELTYEIGERRFSELVNRLVPRR